jgi:hypothetical protein
MTTKTTLSRTIRLAVGTAAALMLMSQAAQASSSGYQGTYRPVAGVVSLSPDRADGVGTSHAALGQPVTTAQTASARSTGTGFDWFAATMGAGSTLVVVLIAGAGLVARGRRHDPLSA